MKLPKELTDLLCMEIDLEELDKKTRRLKRGVKPAPLGPGTPEYRECLDRAMIEWSKHKKTLPKTLMGKRYRPGIYAFAYWLIRYSNLVKPA